jgi:hypothetical protein
MTRPQRTTASRAAAGATLLVGLLLVPRILMSPPTALLLLELVGVVVAVAASVGLWLSNSFESRLAAVMLAVTVVACTVLGLTLGLPGEPGPEELTVGRVLLIAVSAVAAGLVAVDARVRAAQRESARRPYAL